MCAPTSCPSILADHIVEQESGELGQLLAKDVHADYAKQQVRVEDRSEHIELIEPTGRDGEQERERRISADWPRECCAFSKRSASARKS